MPFIEDIMLGGHSLLHAKHWDAHAVGKAFHLGAHPVRVAGMKVYRTTEDTCILETPVMWGSTMAVDVAVYVKAGPLRVVIPVSVSDVQFKVRVCVWGGACVWGGQGWRGDDGDDAEGARPPTPSKPSLAPAPSPPPLKKNKQINPPNKQPTGARAREPRAARRHDPVHRRRERLAARGAAL